MKQLAITIGVLWVSSAVAGEPACLLKEWVKAQDPVPELVISYSRAEWTHWVDADKDCQDARQEALIRGADPVTLSTNGCTVTGGLWLDPYTGKTFIAPSKMDVDHMIPLKEAAESGGQVWSKDQKKAFANDLTTDVPQLIAVSASANRAKGAKDPAEWLPTADMCQYVLNWVGVKKRWELKMDEVEKAKIMALLEACP